MKYNGLGLTLVTKNTMTEKNYAMGIENTVNGNKTKGIQNNLNGGRGIETEITRLRIKVLIGNAGSQTHNRIRAQLSECREKVKIIWIALLIFVVWLWVW